MSRFTTIGVVNRAVPGSSKSIWPRFNLRADPAREKSFARAYTTRALDRRPALSGSGLPSATSRIPRNHPTPFITPSSVQKRSFFPFPSITKLAKAAATTKLTKMAASAAESIVTSSAAKDGEVQTDGDRQTFHSRKILPYSQQQLYNLVADVPSYSTYIPFCSSSAVLKPGIPGQAPSSSSDGREVDSKWSLTTSGQEPFEVDAELKVGFAGFDEAYVSRVKGIPFESVSATSGEANLFKSLSTTWSFSPASGLSPHPSNSIPSSSPDAEPRPTQSLTEPDPARGPTLLTIDLAFEFTNPLHRMASQAVLPKVADKMVDAFEKRCLEVYGKGKD